MLTTGGIRQGLRKISADEVSHIQEVVKLFPYLSRKALSQTLCEHLSWHSPSGALKVNNCLMLLNKLEDKGLIVLPKKSNRGRLFPDKRPELTQRTTELQPQKGSLKEFTPIKLDAVREKTEVGLWNEYVERYHYLGYRRPFGNWLRYFISAGGERLGCILISGASKTLYHRDSWISWNPEQRRRNLPWIINNSRYLIFPWVEIPHLASHVLGQLVRCVAQDWEERWGYRPVLMETFIDPQQYSGTCYRAAGWAELGLTSGEGAIRPGKHYTTSPKSIFVKPLSRNFQTLLCSEQLQGRVIE